MQFSWTGVRPASVNIFVTSRTRSKTTGGVTASASVGLKDMMRTNFVPSRCMRGIARRTSPNVTSKGVSTVFAQFMMVEPKQYTPMPLS